MSGECCVVAQSSHRSAPHGHTYHYRHLVWGNGSTPRRRAYRHTKGACLPNRIRESETTSTTWTASHMLFTIQPLSRTTSKSISHRRRYVCRDDTHTILGKLTLHQREYPSSATCASHVPDSARLLSQPSTSVSDSISSKLNGNTEIRTSCRGILQCHFHHHVLRWGRRSELSGSSHWQGTPGSLY